MIVDVFTYNGEKELLDLRLNVLDEYVDQFIIVEACNTFSGKAKPLYYERDEHLFAKWKHKIKYHVINQKYTEEERALAKFSPNTQGAEHWQREFLQKESIKKALVHLNNKDIVYVGDVDEIWDSSLPPAKGKKLKLRVYSYYLNNRSNEEFWGTYVNTYKNIKNKCLNHLRTNAPKTKGDYGWHFTSMGGLDEVRRKLNDSYTQASYNTAWVQENLEDNYSRRKDYLGRAFEFKIDESEWPEYLKENKDKYKRLTFT